MSVKSTIDTSSALFTCRTALMAAMALIASVAGRDAIAAWEITPQASAGIIYEDNARFQNNNEDDATGVLFDGRVDLTWLDERTDLTLTPRGRFGFYFDSKDEDLEDDDLYLDFRSTRRTLKSEFGLNAGWSDIAIRTAELASAVPDDPDAPISEEGDSGDTRFINDSRERWYVRPFLTYELSPRNRISARVDYADVSYDRTTSGRRPFDVLTGTLSGERVLNERNSVFLEIYGSQFNSDDALLGIDNTTDTYGASLIFSRAISETLTASVTLGGSTSDFEITRTPDLGDQCLDLDDQGNLIIVPCKFEDDDSNFIGNVSLRKRGQRTVMNFDLGRSIAPSSNGLTVVRDTLRFYINRSMTQLWSTRFGVVAFQEETNGNLTNRDIDYVRADVSLIRRLSERWSVSARYQYTWRDEDQGVPGVDGTAAKNLVLLEIIYRGIGYRF
jgi:hypothetical protein